MALSFWIHLDLALRWFMAPSATPTAPLCLWLPWLTVHLQVMVPAAAAGSIAALAGIRPLVLQPHLLHVHHAPSCGHQLRAPGMGGEGLTYPEKGQQPPLRFPAGPVPTWILLNTKHSLLQGDQHPSGGSISVQG